MTDEIVRIAAEAGDVAMQFYKHTMNVESKEDRTPLTDADRASHRFIVDALRDLTPECPVLSEESKEAEMAERRSWDRFWLVDPLDGTKEFLKQTGHFTINIAFVENHEATLGVIHAPAIDRFYYAARGQGAFRRDSRSGVDMAISISAPADPLRVAASVDHLGQREQDLIASLGETTSVFMGSSLKFCLVAEGAADLYPRFVPTMEWDTAAAQVVVEEAGGTVADETFAPLRYNKHSLRNPPILTWGHGSVGEQLREILL